MLKLVGTHFNLSISNLSTSAFKLTRSDFAANLDVSIPVTFLESDFVAQLDKSTLTLTSPPNGSYSLSKY